jgi:acetyltransferase-like isoleucine patch superfamily enzyme
MIEIVIIGSGGLASDITTCFDGITLKTGENIEIKGYVDYDYNVDKYWKRYNHKKPVLADIDSYIISGNEFFVVGIADIKFRKTVIDIVKSKGGKFMNLVHPTAIVDSNAILGNGNLVFPNCFIGGNVIMGDFNLMTIQSIVGHDCRVGNNNSLSTTILCGHAKIGNDNFFGIRSTVVPCITLGSRNVIQAGMVVDQDVTDGTVVFQRLKKNFKKPF